MIYRIDIQHFLTHAIDYFTAEEIIHFQYAIISSIITNQGTQQNMAKISSLYPLPEITITYDDYKDKKLMEKMYMDFLCPTRENDCGLTKNSMDNIFYKTFINPLNLHHDIVILCDRKENDYIDVLCKVLKKEYKIEVIDLNKLFSEGRIGPIYIDRKEIWNNCVDIRRRAVEDGNKYMATTEEGRLKLLKSMSKEDKINKLKELGVDPSGCKEKELNKLLIDVWVKDSDY